MAGRKMITVDGNEAAASVAHRVSEVIAIYPITPSSTMGELADEWSAKGKHEHLGHRPDGGRDAVRGRRGGAVHGALQAGALATTFTASQGLLLMIPNMYKIAGELTPFMHARRGAHAGDARALDLRRPLRRDGLPPDRLRACSLRLGAGGARLRARRPRRDARARVPFLHFFDGFRTSHEIAKIEQLDRRRPARMIDES